jgi:hypothetical protein
MPRSMLFTERCLITMDSCEPELQAREHRFEAQQRQGQRSSLYQVPAVTRYTN